MAYDMFSKYGLDKVNDAYSEQDISEEFPWTLVKTKRVLDSDGFWTDYAWYTNGYKHIFMFGDTDFTEPDESYADWEAETETEAQEWFDSYNGFEDDWMDLESNLDEECAGNSDFLNEGFSRTFGEGLLLED